MYYDYYLYNLTYFVSLYSGYPLIVRMTVIMVLVLLLISIVGFLQLLFVGYKINKRDRRIKDTRQHFEDRLVFVMNNDTNYAIEEVKELLQYDVKNTKNWKADVLTDIVLSVKNLLNKEGKLNTINYKNCLEALRIMGFWEKRIKKSGLNNRRKALEVVGEIDNGVNIGTITKSTFHKNKYLRKTARDLYTSFDNYDPFKFMEENFDESFTNLDKLRLHSTLIKRDKEVKLPNLLRWVNNSKNPNYIIFLLKEVAFFRQYEAISTLMIMLDKYENNEVRAQIVYTLGELGATECVSDLVSRFSLESRLVRDAIIVAMGKIRTDISLDFLIKMYEFTEESNMKMLIARSIKNHGTEGVNALRSFQRNVKDKVTEELLLEHVISEVL